MSTTTANKPLTVVIPVFNREKELPGTLSHVALQNPDLFNLVIVDNNSTDNSMKVVQQWVERNPRFSTTLLKESHQSAAAARNKGLSVARTPWVMFFDSDDVMLPGHVQTAVEMALANPEAQIIGWDVRLNLPDGKQRIMRFPDSDLLANHLVHGVLSTLRYMVRTDFIMEAGGWNADILKWDDLELGVRLLLNNPKVVRRTGNALVDVYFTEQSITGTTYASGEGKWERTLDEVQTLLDAHESTCSQWIDYRRADLAATYYLENRKDLASRLMAQATLNARNPFMVKVIYNLKKFIPRGTWRIASLFIR